MRYGYVYMPEGTTDLAVNINEKYFITEWTDKQGGFQLARLLVIDDEKAILDLVKNGLEKDGHIVAICESAAEVAVERLKDYDLILLDIMMPDVDGFTLCKKIRGLVDCPILFLTAKVLETDIIYGLGLGADDYITKPFRIGELRARVYWLGSF